MKLEKEDLAEIAAAVVATLKSEGLVAAAGTTAAKDTKATTSAKDTKGAKDTKAAAPAPDEKKEPDADAILKRRAEVLGLVKALGEKIGKPEAKKFIERYAPTMGEVAPKDFDALEADLKAATEAADKPKSEEDDY